MQHLCYIVYSLCTSVMFYSIQVSSGSVHKNHHYEVPYIEEFIDKLLTSDKFDILADKIADKAAEKIKIQTSILLNENRSKSKLVNRGVANKNVSKRNKINKDDKIRTVQKHERRTAVTKYESTTTDKSDASREKLGKIDMQAVLNRHAYFPSNDLSLKFKHFTSSIMTSTSRNPEKDVGKDSDEHLTYIQRSRASKELIENVQKHSESLESGESKYSYKKASLESKYEHDKQKLEKENKHESRKGDRSSISDKEKDSVQDENNEKSSLKSNERNSVQSEENNHSLDYSSKEKNDGIKYRKNDDLKKIESIEINTKPEENEEISGQSADGENKTQYNAETELDKITRNYYDYKAQNMNGKFTTNAITKNENVTNVNESYKFQSDTILPLLEDVIKTRDEDENGNVKEDKDLLDTKRIIRKEGAKLFTFEKSSDYDEYHEELSKALRSSKHKISPNARSL